MFERNIPDKELERLSRAITEAILNSKNVKKIIKEIREKDLILPNPLMVMVLKLETLSNMTDDLDNDVDDDSKDQLTVKRKKKTKKQLIDGKELNTNEVAFQEFLIKKFNDKEWLKKNGLTL